MEVVLYALKEFKEREHSRLVPVHVYSNHGEGSTFGKKHLAAWKGSVTFHLSYRNPCLGMFSMCACDLAGMPAPTVKAAVAFKSQWKSDKKPHVVLRLAVGARNTANVHRRQKRASAAAVEDINTCGGFLTRQRWKLKGMALAGFDVATSPAAQRNQQ